MTTRAQYNNRGAAELEQFSDRAHAAARDNNAILDSAAAASTSRELLNSGSLPKEVQDIVALMPEDQQHRVLDSVLIGSEVYRQQHGVLPTGDVLQAALQQGESASRILDSAGRPTNNPALDGVGSTSHHDQLSAQPNRIVVAITSALAEAIPFATYLPTDIGSNEARLGIVSHQAGSLFGAYTLGELLDGVNVGKTYVSAERRVTIALATDRLTATGKITGVVGGTEDTVLLRGRTIVLVNGFPCAYENNNTASTVANAPISGSVRLGTTDYAISGTVAPNTGEVSLAFTPALPAGSAVEAEGFIDFEKVPSLTPKIVTQVQTYSLYATPWRVIADQTVDSKTQYGNELSLDLQSENLIAIRNQFGMERFYSSLAKLKALAVSNARTYDFDWAGQKSDKTRARIWQDAIATVGIADQVMAEDTMDHGITHIFVGKLLAAQFQTMSADVFQPSGITARPGIYRLGRWFGRYEVYYTPKIVTETTNSAQMLCIGRSTQVARCPVVLGDAVAPTYLPLAMNTDMKYQNAFYARNFTSVNPHQPSALGAALINITNITG